jgi:DNA-directed RNA polymerase subunit beta
VGFSFFGGVMTETIRFGRFKNVLDVPALTELHVKAYVKFLQRDLAPDKREDLGLESILRETFPIKNYDGTISLEYVHYEIGQPRYTPEECRMLRLSYGAPLKVRLRLNKPENPIEEDVYLGEIPLMIGGGAFIVNGAERVLVNQLHRSPGIDFMEERVGDKKMHSCWIVPGARQLDRDLGHQARQRRHPHRPGRQDPGHHVPPALLAGVLDERGHHPRLLRDRRGQALGGRRGPADRPRRREGRRRSHEEREDPRRRPAHRQGHAQDHGGGRPQDGGDHPKSATEDNLILNTLEEDDTHSHEEALLKIYGRLRPARPRRPDKAKQLFYERFFDPQRYRLGRVGRFRLNRKFNMNVPESEMTVQKDDVVNSVKYIMKMRRNEGTPDDIDHLGNRRVRTIDELAGEEVRKGFLRLKRSILERLNMTMQENLTPKNLINSKTVSSAIEYFFGRSELSQVIDQTNPLSQLTHERRLSALGPGGLNRKRAGFEVRDVHISHYGRVCPIETPEGTNIGLISSLAIYASVDPYGFLTAPYQVVKNGKVTDQIVFLRADEEVDKVMAPADVETEKDGKLVGPQRPRHGPRERRVPVRRLRQGRVRRRVAGADRRRLGGADPVPRARRRQPRADGFEHAAPGGAR